MYYLFYDHIDFVAQQGFIMWFRGREYTSLIFLDTRNTNVFKLLVKKMQTTCLSSIGRLTFKLLNLKTKLLSGTGQIQQSVVRVQQDGHKHKNIRPVIRLHYKY